MSTLGVAYIVLSGLGFAGFDILRKILVKRMPPLIVLAYVFTLQVPLFFAWTLKEGNWEVPLEYLPILISLILLQVISNYLFIKSLQYGDLSLTLPLLSFIPVFVTLNGFLWLGEIPTLTKLLGIFVVVVGALVLQLKKEETTTLPLLVKRMLHNKSSAYMLMVALCWSATPVLDKIGLHYVSPAMHGLLQIAGVAIIFIALALKKYSRAKIILPAKDLGLIGLSVVAIMIGITSYFFAIQLMMVSIYEALKRVIGIFAAIFFGHFLFEEPLTPHKVIAMALLSIGVVLVVMA